MRKLLFKIGLLVSICTNAYSEGIDGFFSSFGLGIANTDTEFKQTYDGFNNGELEGEGGLGFSAKIGSGIGDDLAIYFFINSTLVPGFDKDPDSALVNSVLGIGFNYYIDSSNIFYTIAGMGKGQFMKLTDSPDVVVGDDDIYQGDGYMLGLGVNLFPNVHLELVYLNTQIDDTQNNNKLVVETKSTMLLLNYYLY